MSVARLMLHERPLPGWPAGVPEWQPIETAPRDGTSILVYGEWEIRIADWYEYFGYTGWHEAAYLGDRLNIVPTHWLPLPPAPCGSSPRDG